jgi:hypothetical protein
MGREGGAESRLRVFIGWGTSPSKFKTLLPGNGIFVWFSRASCFEVEEVAE